MSVCTFIASDMPLPEVKPPQEYPLAINVDTGTIYDGGADENFFLLAFPRVEEYTGKKYGVYLEWNYTDGRAKEIIEYIRAALRDTDSVELWRVWLADYYEYEDSPVVHRKTITADALTVEDIKEIEKADIWNTPDKIYPNRPSFYCLTIVR